MNIRIWKGTKFYHARIGDPIPVGKSEPMDKIRTIGRTSGEARAWLRGLQTGMDEVITVVWIRRIALGRGEWEKGETFMVTKDGFLRPGTNIVREVLPWT